MTKAELIAQCFGSKNYLFFFSKQKSFTDLQYGKQGWPSGIALVCHCFYAHRPPLPPHLGTHVGNGIAM